MIISEKGKDLIKSFESLELNAYKCPADVWTIGYGHTRNVKQGDIINDRQANCLLMQDLLETEKAINKLVHVKINQNQYDALCSLVFNIGVGNFSKSTLLAKLNAGDYSGASDQFKRWNKSSSVVLVGLIRRRQAEEELFNGH